MKINTQKIKAFFGLSPEATDAELDRKVDEELKARDEAATKEGGENAGTEDTTETDAGPTAEDTNADEQGSTTSEDTPTGVTMKQVQEAVTAAVTAATAPLLKRLDAIEAQDADEPTGGKPDPVTVTDDDQPLWAHTPANQKAAQVFGTKD